MGITKVKLTVKNPQNTKLSLEGDFMVDSGAHYTVLTKNQVRKLNLKSSFNQEFVLADGRVVKRPVGSAVIRFGDRELSVPVVLGGENDESLLGVTTLEAFGLMLDPFKRTIYPSKLMLG